MPVVVIPAASVGRTGYEGVAQLNADTDLKTRLEALRKAAGRARGAVGVIIDAGCRDVVEMTKMGFPVQTFFLYCYEPGGNRFEIGAGGYLIFDPDWQPIVWGQAERAKGQAWGLQTVHTFHTYGTPPVETDPAQAH